MLGWRPPRRLHHIAAIQARALQLPRTHKDDVIGVFFTLSFPSTSTSSSAAQNVHVQHNNRDNNNNHNDNDGTSPRRSQGETVAKEQQQTPSPTEWVCVYQSEVVTHNTSAPQWKPFVLVPHTRACGECDSTHTHVLVTIYAKMHNVLTSYPSSPSVIVSYDIHLDQLHTIGTHLSSPIRTNTNTNTNTGGSSSTTTTATTPVAPDSFFAPNTILFDFFDGEYAVYPSTATPMKTSIAIKGGSGENGDKNEYDDDDGIKRSRSVSPPTRQQHQRPEDENKIVSITSEDSQEQATSLHQNHDARDTTQPPTTTITTAPAINARLIEVDQFRRQLQDLIALRRRLVDLSHRCQQARNSIDAVVAQQSEARHQHAQLRQCAAQAHEIRRKQAVVAQRTDAAQQECVAAERTATVTSQALVSTLQALVSAYRRITAGEASLEGEEGRGRFAVALGALIGRRCLMVSQLGWTLRLTPVASLPHPGAGSTTTASETVTAASSPDALSASLLDEQLDLQWVGASPATAASSPRIGINTSTSASTKNVVKLTICGMSLDSSVWRNAFDPGGGYDWDPTQDRAASVALGYAALFVDRMAEMLGVPLRYPIRFRGSQSVVVDNYPPAGNWNPQRQNESGTTTAMHSSSIASAHAAGGAQQQQQQHPYTPPVEYPLYCTHNRDRPKFAVGVFLLNKDAIQLLQAHGISAAGPSQLLQNLHKLVAAAQSGLGGGVGGDGYW